MDADCSQAVIANASLVDGRLVDVHLRAGRVSRVLPPGSAATGARIEAEGGCLLPALHDHHIHLLATAAALSSVKCGEARSRDELSRMLREAEPDAGGWVRGVGFHPRLTGEIDREWLDAHGPAHPVRVAHTSGRLWYMNSIAIERLGEGPWERAAGQLTGRVYEADAWLRERLPSRVPNLARLSRQMAAHGIVGVTDTGPSNGPDELGVFGQAQASQDLLQQVQMMGGCSLNDSFQAQACAPVESEPELFIGALKIHLLESRLPDYTSMCEQIRACHRIRRPVAFHCVSETELVFALTALRESGVLPGDRIEHAGICTDPLLAEIRALNLAVVSQPGFVLNRGDRYLDEVPETDHPHLYRLQAFRDKGVRLAASSDAPYGPLNPWLGMHAAVTRRTALGRIIGAGEALAPEVALALYTADLANPGPGPVLPVPGAPADLVLLEQPWARARDALDRVKPRLCLRHGRPISGA